MTALWLEASMTSVSKDSRDTVIGFDIVGIMFNNSLHAIIK
jgi:hypothetical protein